MDLSNLMKQANKMQKDMAKIEKELAETNYEGEAQAVKCVINGNMQLVSINIEDDLLNVDDKDVLQDMIVLAVNNASAKATSDRNKKLGAVTGGMKIPGM